MFRWVARHPWAAWPHIVLLALSVACLCAQPPDKLQKERPKPPAAKPAIPPVEDTAVAPTEYSFNPLQAEKDLKVGNYYWKLGKFRAAEARFREATRWNEGYAEAWLRLGEVAEKLKDPKEA